MTFYRYLLVGLVLCGCAWGQTLMVDCSKGQGLCPANRGCEGLIPEETPKAKAPKVVPAIQMLKTDCSVSDQLLLPFCSEAYKSMQWGCADKSRVLLTTEEGKKICVKFSGGNCGRG